MRLLHRLFALSVSSSFKAQGAKRPGGYDPAHTLQPPRKLNQYG
jgi:hypothetical protein